MSLRWRDYGRGELICGAKSKELPNDSYIDDTLHYELSVIQGVVIPNDDEDETGLWHWKEV